MKKELVITYSKLGFVRTCTPIKVKDFEQAKEELANIRNSFPYISYEVLLLFAQYWENGVVKKHWCESTRQWTEWNTEGGKANDA